MSNMTITHLLLLLSFPITFGLQSKMFYKNQIEPTSISDQDIKEIKETTVLMDKITCSTFCLKDSDNCEAFYFKENSCMMIKDITGMVKTTDKNTDALTIYSHEVSCKLIQNSIQD